MTIRTGCSSSLVALHEACLALSRGDCSAAILGGANLILAPGMTAAMTEQGVLSPDGSCKTFSADANGYARGEAVNAIFLKPLEAALRAGSTEPGSARKSEEQALLAEWLHCLMQASSRASQRILALQTLAEQSAKLAEMDFSFLFDSARELFSVGFNVTERRGDASFYDLLASEALTSVRMW